MIQHATDRFHRPRTFEALFDLIDATEGRYAFVAGGVTINWHGNRAPTLISLAELLPVAIGEQEDALEVGAGATLAVLAERGPRVPVQAEHRKVIEVLGRAAHLVASPQIRNLATIGGNLVTHFDFCDPLGFLYLLEPELRVRERSGEHTFRFSDLLNAQARFRLGRERVLTHLRFNKARLDDYRGGVFLKLSRVGRDIATLNATILRRAHDEPSWDIAVGSCWSGIQLFRQVRSVEDIESRVQELPAPKKDRRASSRYRQAVLVPWLSRGMKGTTDGCGETDE